MVTETLMPVMLALQVWTQMEVKHKDTLYSQTAVFRRTTGVWFQRPTSPTQVEKLTANA